jgi:hypothetical protein
MKVVKREEMKKLQASSFHSISCKSCAKENERGGSQG